MPKYAVVEFITTKEIEVVSCKWISHTICYWPPYKSSTRIKRAVLKHEEPDERWISYEIRCMGSYATHDEASRKLQKVKKMGINSDVDDYRHRKHQTVPICSDESFNETKHFTKWHDMRLPTTPHIIQISSVAASSSIGETNANEYPSVDHESEYQKMVLRELQDVKAALFQQGEMIEAIFSVLTSLKSEATAEECAENSTLMKANESLFQLPLKSMEEINELENLLKNEPNANEHLSTVLYGVGGINFGNTVRRILKKLLTDELASAFSWLGTKGKRPFSDLHIAKAVFVATRKHIAFQEKSDSEIEFVVKNWLRHAKARRGQNVQHTNICET